MYSYRSVYKQRYRQGTLQSQLVYLYPCLPQTFRTLSQMASTHAPAYQHSRSVQKEQIHPLYCLPSF